MIEVFTNPLLLDFIKVCIAMPQDERDQLESFSGQPYNIDSTAVGNFCVEGPKWVIKADGEPIVIGGFALQRTGVWRDFMLTTPEAWTHHWFPVTRICRRIMNAMFASGQAHRLECVTLASRVQAIKWYRVLGYTLEATLPRYCADGKDAISFSRVA